MKAQHWKKPEVGRTRPIKIADGQIGYQAQRDHGIKKCVDLADRIPKHQGTDS